MMVGRDALFGSAVSEPTLNLPLASTVAAFHPHTTSPYRLNLHGPDSPSAPQRSLNLSTYHPPPRDATS